MMLAGYRNGNFMAISKDQKKFEISKGIEIQIISFFTSVRDFLF